MATTGHENESINVGGLKSSLQALKTKYVDDLDSRVDTLETAVGSGGSVDTRISNAIKDLDSGASQTAGTDGLALSITETDGKITSISGSIATNIYDTYGAATSAANTAKTDVIGGATTNGNTLKKLEDRVSPLESAVGSGGSVDTRIATAKSEILGDAGTDYNTLGKLEDAIQTEASTRSNEIGTDSTAGTVKGRINSLETLVGSTSVSTQIDNKINALDSTKSQNAGSDGLALSITETDGKIASISGSIASGTYDAAGSASSVENRLNQTKANWETSLSGYGIGDAYTKDETKNMISSEVIKLQNKYTGEFDVGILYTDGAVHDMHVNYMTTKFIHLGKGEQIVTRCNISSFTGSYCFFCIYDLNKNLTSYLQSVSPYEYPYFRYTASQECYIKLSGEYYTYPELVEREHWIYVGYNVDNSFEYYDSLNSNSIVVKYSKSVWEGKKVGFLGDSITAGRTIDSAYQNKTGCVAVNYGISGTSIAGTGSDAMCVRYTSMANDLSLIIVLGGVNDQRGGVPLGEFKYYNSDGSRNNTFYGALHTLMRGLKIKYPTKPIVFMTPMHNSYRDASYGDTGDYNYEQFQQGILVENKFPLRNKTTIDDSIATGDVLSKYVKAIKDVAAFYSIFVIDLYEISTFQPLLDGNKNTYLPDGIHPNSTGGQRITDIIYPYLENLNI